LKNKCFDCNAYSLSHLCQPWDLSSTLLFSFSAYFVYFMYLKYMNISPVSKANFINVFKRCVTCNHIYKCSPHTLLDVFIHNYKSSFRFPGWCLSHQVRKTATLWLRRSVAYLPPLKPRIDTRSFHAWSVEDTLTLGTIFLSILQFSRFVIILPMIRIQSFVTRAVKLKKQHL